MRYLCGLAAVALLAGCNSSSDQPASLATATGAVAIPAAASADDTTAAWLDMQVVPRQQGRYAPRDECGNLSGAREFRLRLADAVRKRDADTIAAMAVEDIRLGFGGQDSRKRFLQQLKASDGKAMGELEQLLQLGCAAADGGGLTIPSYFAQDFGDTDSYSAMLVTGVDVPLRTRAEANAPVIEGVSWDVATLVGGLRPDAAFQQVKTASGRTGFVETGKLRSLLDYRLLAVKQGDDWKITALLAGD